jgi:hypothetical protein
MKMLLLALVVRMDIGTRPFVVVGGFAPAGLNVNNNNFDNDNNGVGGLRKSCYSSLSLKNSARNGLDPTADHLSDVLDDDLECDYFAWSIVWVSLASLMNTFNRSSL